MSRTDTPMAHAVLTLETVVVASPEQVSSKLGEEVVILNLRNGVYYGLDPIGTRIWELIQEPRSVRQVCEVLLEEYDVTFEQCAEDVLALMRDLQAQGLIEARDAQGT
ncbi:lasso peptide biosynthesis PqqD family chaperone [Rhodothermus marinus]|uniref:lasso peptide biosynthesis PqqD family chaperone n=1 Tax=Rhodothermus marinus TaxID=29549 RepID=UPI0004A6C7D8|nr:lasso peptide biosynthesis PqqD family chaperone [Rhodothermus marinus]MBO2491592.1 lasso peptide biosynthesis PqqD family chaperone [Rhodothermus marinus]